jgi:hypothetical protein
MLIAKAASAKHQPNKRPLQMVILLCIRSAPLIKSERLAWPERPRFMPRRVARSIAQDNFVDKRSFPVLR